MKIYYKVIILGIGFFSILIPQISQHSDNESQTASVLTFAYDPLRSGSTKSLIDPRKNINIKHVTFEQGKSGGSLMPLYINGFLKKESKYFPNQRVIIFADKGRKILKAVDIDTDQVIWKTTLPFYIVSTPVIHLETGSIYVLTIRWQNKGNAPGNPPIYYHELFLIKMDGSVKDRIYVNLANLMNFKDRNNFFGAVPAIHCKTALGLNLQVNPSYVYFGCSVDVLQMNVTPPPSKAYNYGSYRGVHGSVISVALNPEGTFKGQKYIKAFLTSTVESHPMTGFDTGVYNAGSGPSVLPDGSLLIATGNGPVFPEHNNFGCSVVRVDGSNLKPKRNHKGELFFFSIDTAPSSECWYENVEYASSSIATAVKDEKYFSAVTSKNGYLTVFNPFKLSSFHKPISVLIGEMKSYGQPVIFVNSEQQVNVFAISYFHSKYPGFPYQEFIADESIVESLKDVSKTECFGYASKKPNNKPLLLMYSGSIRDIYANAVKGSHLHKHLITPFFYDNAPKGYGPFNTIKTLGYVFTQKYNQNMKFKPLDLFLFFRKNNLLSLETQNQSNFFILKNSSTNKTKCQRIGPLFQPLYKIFRQKKPYGFKKGLYAHSFIIQDNYRLKKMWSFHDESLKPSRTNPVLSVNIKNKHTVLVFPAEDKDQTEDNEKKYKSFLILLNGKTGYLIGKVPFPGKVHFSMPLIVDNFIFIPTELHGIQKFFIESKKKFIFKL